MNPKEILQKFKELENKISKLESTVSRSESKGKENQLFLPLDVASVGVLNNALASNRIDKLRTNQILLTTGTSDEPDQEGQIVYKDSTKTLKVMLNGALRTITTA